MAAPIETIQQNIKQVPQNAQVRLQIRDRSKALAEGLDRGVAPDMSTLRSAGQVLLRELDLPQAYLGFAMVEISNAYWLDRFMAVGYDRRLLLLPQCLSDKDVCRGYLDSIGLHCADCGACDISGLRREAESLGYRVITAEGTSSVLTQLLEGKSDAVLGVACLDSLEKSHSRISQIGIPHVAVPLLTDGCINTTAEMSEIRRLMSSVGSDAPASYRSYLPLLRQSYNIFSQESVRCLLEAAGIGHGCFEDADRKNPMQTTDCIALDWLMSGGKRLRPFVTLAAYCVGKYGQQIARPDFDPSEYIPEHIRCLAMAIEALHKASLVHDDIEDKEEFRYGRKTVQAEYGVYPAINVGDYLVGLGYKLITSQTKQTGAEETARILSSLSKAHLDLCRGQGAEIMWKGIRGESLKPVEALSIYAMKTSPAFEAAVVTGLIAAGVQYDADLISRFCVYLGEAYQIENDLDDWTSDKLNHITSGGDILAERPTILWAFACESGEASNLKQAILDHDQDSQVDIAAVLFDRLGVFAKARALRDKLRRRAMHTARNVADPDISSLLEFLLKVILPERMQ